MPRSLRACFVLVSAPLALALGGEALGQSDSSDAAIKPYDGPPIYLDEPADSVPPQPVDTTVTTQTYEDGSTQIERGVTRYSDDTLENHGVYREFYEDGQQFVDGRYDKGKPVGEWTFWRPNGQVAKKVTYKNGTPDGAVELRRADGTLKAKRSYSEGLRHGVWQLYAEDGEQLLREYQYKNGEGDGLWKWWYPSGELLRETPFSNGLVDGVATEYAQDGTKRAEVPFKEGKRHGVATQWLADGRKVQQRYEMGKPVEGSAE